MSGVSKRNAPFAQFKELSRKLTAVPKREADEQKSRAKKRTRTKPLTA